LLAALLLVALPASASPSTQPQFGPEPAWVAPGQEAEVPSRDAAVGGERILLSDRQVRVDANGSESYLHVEREIVEESGLQSASQVVIEFDPTYETVTIHSVVVRRDGMALDRLDRSSLKVIEREPNLDSQVFDGRLSAILLVTDLRVHDVLSFSYPLRGSDPTLHGKYVDTFALAGPEPIERLRARLLAPTARAFTVSVEGPAASLPDTQATRRVVGDYQEYIWDRKHLAAVVDEPLTPSWYIPLPVVAVTEFSSWREVSRWGAELFKPYQPTSALRQWVAKTQAASRTIDDFVIDTIRFVQDEVRYVAVEVGFARRRPNDPATVFARRYGDCKDKTALLTALLRLGGVQAQPALVSSTLGHTLDRWPPDPSQFDHAIVRVPLAGTDHWVDPTETLQGGTLADLHSSDFERALPLEDRGAELTDLDPQPKSQVIHDDFRVHEPEEATPTLLDSTREYRGGKANFMRRMLRSWTSEQIREYFTRLYEREFPSIRLHTPIETTDDRSSNMVRVVAHFEIPKFWTWAADSGRYEASWFARRADEFIATPAEGRSAPLAVLYPFRLHETVRLTAPFDLGSRDEESTVDGPAFHLDFTRASRRGTWWNSYELRTKTASLEDSDFDEERRAAAALIPTAWGFLSFVPDGLNRGALVGLLAWLPLLLWASWRAYRSDPGAASTETVAPSVPRKIRGLAIVLVACVLFLALVESFSTWVDVRAVLSLRGWHTWVSDAYGRTSPWRAGSAVFDLAVLSTGAAYCFVLIALALKRRRSLRWHATYAFVGVPVAELIDIAYRKVLLPTAPVLMRWAWVALGVKFGLMAICVAYVWRSRRFESTFVRAFRPRAVAGGVVQVEVAVEK
jgi:hypothetical protein